MKKSTILYTVAVAVVIGLCGCGTGAPIDPARLEVNETLRGACPFADDFISIFIQAVEEDRLNGWTPAGEFNAVAPVCINEAPTPEISAQCGVCITALINQVYGL